VCLSGGAAAAETHHHLIIEMRFIQSKGLEK
jgi:hypothetical protein